jgi:two-component system phosphate regulon sensor histidine kinase PhoR
MGRVAAMAGLLAAAARDRARARLPLLASVLSTFTVVVLLAGVGALGWFAGVLALTLAVLLPGEMPVRASAPRASDVDRDHTRGEVVMPPAEVSAALSWKELLDAMLDPAIVLDASGAVIHANPLVVDVFPRVRLRQPVSHLTRSPELLDAIDRVRAGEQRVSVALEDRVPFQRRVLAMVGKLRGPDVEADAGAPEDPLVLIVFRDITDQEKLAQMRADFIAHASHELRTPLASLRGFVETLQGPARNDAEARDRFLSIMGAQALRMTRLIDDLLSLSRVEMNVHLAPQGSVDLEEVVGFVAETLQPLADQSGIQLTVEPPPAPCEARGDWDELVQVVQNLIQNAIKYGRRGGRVDVVIGFDPSTGQPLVAVKDDGLGIPVQHLPRLTERFYRVNVSASRDKGGTGLGLAIVKHIVTRHRGELRIESVVDQGSTFTVVLPPAPVRPQVDDDLP